MTDDFPENLYWPAARLSLNEKPLQEHDRSYFGGEPEVPADFEWPLFENRPLDFIMQLDLADISGLETGLDLPKSGRLLFFYDTDTQPWGFQSVDRGSSSVIFIETLEALIRITPPKGARSFPQQSLTFTQILTVPDAWSPWLNSLNLTLDDRQNLAERTAELLNIGGYIGGHPNPIQQSMELECEFASTGIDASVPVDDATARLAQAEELNWRLLLQFPSIDEIDLSWGDGGMIYFWVKVDALKRNDFSQAWLILQCF